MSGMTAGDPWWEEHSVPAECEPDDFAFSSRRPVPPVGQARDELEPSPGLALRITGRDLRTIRTRVADLDPHLVSDPNSQVDIARSVHDRVRGQLTHEENGNVDGFRSDRVTAQRRTGESPGRADGLGHRREHGLGGIDEWHGRFGLSGLTCLQT